MESIALVSLSLLSLLLVASVVLLSRQLVTLELRLQMLERSDTSPSSELADAIREAGPSVGAHLRELVPELEVVQSENLRLLILAGTCRSCHKMAEVIGRTRGDDLRGPLLESIYYVVPGSGHGARQLVRALNTASSGSLSPLPNVLRDPVASELAAELHIAISPFFIATDNSGTVIEAQPLEQLEELFELLRVRTDA